jgi:hypothetical protein
MAWPDRSILDRQANQYLGFARTAGSKSANELKIRARTFQPTTNPSVGSPQRRDGRLGRLRTRHAWEFLFGARGGAYGSSDRFIEFAQRAVDPNWCGALAMESAASAVALAQRVSVSSKAAARNELASDHVAQDFVGALADDHQRGIAKVALDIKLR